MRRAYEIPEIQESEYREEFVMKSKIRMNNKKRDNLFALVVAIIFFGLLALSFLISSKSEERLSQYNKNDSDKINVSEILQKESNEYYRELV